VTGGPPDGDDELETPTRSMADFQSRASRRWRRDPPTGTSFAPPKRTPSTGVYRDPPAAAGRQCVTGSVLRAPSSGHDNPRRTSRTGVHTEGDSRGDRPRGSVGKTLQRPEARQLVRHAEPCWAIGDDDRAGAYLGMLSSLDAVVEREGTEDYDEWREAADAEQ